MDSKTFLEYARIYIDKYVNKSIENYLGFSTNSSIYPITLIKTHVFEVEGRMKNKDLGDKLFKILRAKTQDYSPGGNAFSNFETSAKQVGVSVSASICIRIMDKLSRLKNLVSKKSEPSVKDESIADTALDAINYILIEKMYRDYKNNELLPLPKRHNDR